MNRDRMELWKTLMRILGALTAAGIWLVSVMFSVDGFSFKLPRYAAVGLILSLSVTALEMIFNEEGLKHSVTMVLLSLSAYAYDIGTNIIGIWVAQGGQDLSRDPGSIIFPFIVGVFIALAPEPLFAWALIGTGYHDVLTHLFGNPEMTGGGNHGGGGQRNDSARGGGGGDFSAERKRLNQGWQDLAEERRKLRASQRSGKGSGDADGRGEED